MIRKLNCPTGGAGVTLDKTVVTVLNPRQVTQVLWMEPQVKLSGLHSF